MSTIPSSIFTFSTNSFRFPALHPPSPSKLPSCHYPRFCSPGKRPPRLVSSKSSEAEEASSSSSSSSSSSTEEDKWLEKLPDKKRPLFAHSLPCIEAWLRNLGFFQSREDRAVWLVEKPEWHAQLSLDVTDLYIRYLKSGPGNLEKDMERRFSYALSREDIENAILGGP